MARAISMRLSVPKGSPTAGRSARSCEAEVVEDAQGLLGERSLLPPHTEAERRPYVADLAVVWAPTITFSSTVRRGKSARFWNVRAMPRRAMPWAGTSSRSVPSKRTLAARRLVDAADDVEQRRLAGAVRPDQPTDLAGLDREGQLVQRHDAAEAHAHLADVENRQRINHPPGGHTVRAPAGPAHRSSPAPGLRPTRPGPHPAVHRSASRGRPGNRVARMDELLPDLDRFQKEARIWLEASAEPLPESASERGSPSRRSGARARTRSRSSST